MRTPIRTVGAFGGSTEPAVLPGGTCLTYGRLWAGPGSCRRSMWCGLLVTCNGTWRGFRSALLPDQLPRGGGDLVRQGCATGLLSLFVKTGSVDDRSGRSLLLAADGPKTRGCREKRDGQDLKPDREVHPESVPRASAED